MVKEAPKRRVRKPYGFRYNIHRKGTEIGIRWEWLEKRIGRTYEIIAINVVYSLIVSAAAVLVTVFYLLANPRRSLYMAPGLIVLDLAIIGFLLMMTLSDLSSGSLISQARTLRAFKSRQKYIKQGKEQPMLDTGDGEIDEEGYITDKEGRVCRLILVDGFTNPNNFPEERKAQEEMCLAWQKARPRGVAEFKISTVQPQNTKHQVREAKRRERISERKSVKAVVRQQYSHLENRVEGVIPTTVQYILIKAGDRRALDNYLELLDQYVDQGLYYGVAKQNKQQTMEMMTEIRQLS